jgi:hypothetical protein
VGITELDDAVAVAHAVVWSIVTTVDGSGRPRARVLHPMWESSDEGLDGWILTRATPVKLRHLAANPHVSCSYLGANHDVAYFDCVTEWVDSESDRRRVWESFRSLPPPIGYDPATIFPAGPMSPDLRVLHLLPYRVQVGLAVDLAAGARPRLWQSSRAPGRRTAP